MLWIGLLGFVVDWRGAAIISAAISLGGWVVWWRTQPKTPLSTRSLSGWERGAVIVILILAGLILFNAIYWPFGIADAVTIYATFGKQIAQTGRLPTGTLYETYPMLVPLMYAFTHQAAGWINEYLAASIPALLSLDIIGVAYLLGTELYNRKVGITAALLIALAPMFTHWASVGYVDLPAGFFYGLAAVFLLRLERTQAWSDALLMGIMSGLAAWTKNSGLLILPTFGLWIGYRLVTRQTISVRLYAISVAAFAAVAGPWYARNLILAGVIIPPTGWISQAQRTLANLFPYIVDTRYGLVGWVFTLGILWIGWKVVRAEDRAASRFLLIFFLPFFAIWWALFSYDGRFLLVLTAFVAVIGAYLVQELVQRIPARFAMVLAIGVLILSLFAASAAVDFKFDILRHPLMSDAAKHELRLGTDRYQMALYLRTLPTGAHVWTQDLMLPYQADGIVMTVGEWPTAAQLANYEYWVLSPNDLKSNTCTAAPLHVQGEYTLYRVSDILQSGHWVCTFGPQ
jgi:4-amino-4-deoxy-L-arabinose transferase-like glycosyltransferase